MSVSCRSDSAGFTLIEVLVALAVLAVALGALIRTAGDAAANAGHLRDKTLAHWVAMNRIAEQQLAPTWPSVGERGGETEMAGREWHWEEVVEATEDADMRRLTVHVGHADGEDSLVKLIAYLPHRVAAGN